MDKYLDSLGEAAIVSKLDACSRCWQGQIVKANRDKTAFTSHYSLLRFIRMRLGLRLTSGTFQRAVDVIILSERCQYALAYLDDIVVLPRASQVHIKHVRKVLALFCDAEVALKLKNCKFFTKIIDYLGYVVCPSRLEVSSHSTDAIRGVKAPTILT